MRLDPTFGDLGALRAKMMTWARVATRSRDVEDLVQAALLKMIAGRHLAPAVRSEVEPWARVVLMRTAVDMRRAALRQPVPSPIDEFLAAPDNPETSTWCRQMFALAGDDLVRAGMGFEYSRGVKAATLRSRRHRARIALAEAAA